MERRAKEHLYEVDLMRTFIILGVVCVHIVSFFNLFAAPLTSTNVGFDMATTALHFTRESFMFITGMVLFVTYYHRTFRATDFWVKRFKLIVIPYVVWTLLYILFEGTYLKGFDWSFLGVTGNFLMSLLLGSQFYMYFLVVSMQMYIVFPLTVKLLKRSVNYHVWIFIGSFALQIALMWINKDVLQNLNLAHLPGWLSFIIFYRDRNLLTYQFWFISGALFAIHYDRIRSYAREHGKLIISSFVLAILALWGHYAIDRLFLHQDETMSVLVLQPIMIPYSFLVTLVLWRAGLSWSRVRVEPRMHIFSSFIKIAAAASFGVFLVHPFLLHFAELIVYRLHTTADVRLLLIPAVIIFVYGGAILIVRLISNIPLVSYIVGQKTQAPRWMANLATSSTRSQ